MPVLKKLIYETWEGNNRELDFVSSDEVRRGMHTTILTGRNGSHKSTILRELVAAIALPESDSGRRLTFDEASTLSPTTVICVSGSVADRFPAKENGGRSTEFDVPNYIYIGQRVGINLLSKKLPLETAISFALDKSVINRFDWPFYRRAYQYAGIEPRIKLQLIGKGKKGGRLDAATPARVKVVVA